MHRVKPLIDEIHCRRGTNTIIAFGAVEGGATSDPEKLDQFGSTLGLHGIGDQWRAITRQQAVSFATAFLARDLAYNVQAMPVADAQSIAERFVGLFSAIASFFTNTSYTGGTESWSWEPLTDATFDAGLGVVDEWDIGILIVQDED